MLNQNNDKSRRKLVETLVIPVVVLIIGGGTSPWWFTGLQKWINNIYNNDAAKTSRMISSQIKKLEEELNNQRWANANMITDEILLASIKVNPESFVEGKEKISDFKVNTIPCEYLKEVDRLWVDNSKQKFGFSVQAQIWNEVQNSPGNSWNNFADKVGWYKESIWVDRNIIPDYDQANKGYLPTFILVDGGKIDWKTFFNRVKTCGI